MWLNQLTASYRRSTVWTKVAFFALLLSVMLMWTREASATGMEGFSSANFTEKNGVGIFDKFYVDIYDQLVFNSMKNDFEVGQIVNSTKPSEKSLVLDIGSGTGHHVAALTEKGYKAVGIDISQEMVAKSKANYPNNDFTVKDAMNGNSFGANEFTHITCLYFTIYYFQNKQQFFQNCFTWLKPGGHLVVHLTNRNTFDPILPPGNPLMMVSPQKYAKKRITSTAVSFDKFKYEANFALDGANDTATFEERFRNRDNGETFRKNKHHFYMEKQSVILQYALRSGFSLVKKVDMASAQYENQYLYVLVKD